MKLSLFNPVIVAKRTNRLHHGSAQEARMNKAVATCVLIAITSACTKNGAEPASEPKPWTPVANTTSPSLPRPQPTVDPKSSEAAAQLAQKFVDLLNGRKFDEAFMLLGPNASPRSQFNRSWANVDRLHVGMGKPGDQEGAAGSIYLEIPLDVSGSQQGKPVLFGPKLILRRVNDVSGSTEAQRHWHIERVDWDRN